MLNPFLIKYDNKPTDQLILNRPGVAYKQLVTDSVIQLSLSSKSCCLHNQVAWVEQVSPLSLKTCVS